MFLKQKHVVNSLMKLAPGKNLFLHNKNSGEVLDIITVRNFNARPVCLHMIFLLFTLLYLIIWLKINLLISLKEPSIEKALITLHVTTQTGFSLQSSQKSIMHGLVKMYVMC